jgi:hypothetical protein
MTKGSDEGGAFVDVLANSPRGLQLGEAFDAEQHITGVDPTGTHDLTTKGRVVRIGLRFAARAPPSH